MASKRMFDKSLIDSDLFVDLPIPSQCLYFHLSMRADDEGFVGNVNGILRLVGFKNEDIRPLVDRKFILLFESGIIVIRHWKLNNYLRSDRLKPTEYKNEKLLIVENNGKYEFGIPSDNQMTPNGIPSIEESSIEEYRVEEYSIGESMRGENKKPPKKPPKKKYGVFQRVKLTDEEYDNLVKEFGEAKISEQIKLVDEYVESNNNKNKYANFNLVIKKSIKEKWFKQQITSFCELAQELEGAEW